jgi:hypothetical protein
MFQFLMWMADHHPFLLFFGGCGVVSMVVAPCQLIAAAITGKQESN